MKLSQPALLTVVMAFMLCCMEAEARAKKNMVKVKVKDMDKGFNTRDPKDRSQKREILRQLEEIMKSDKNKSNKGKKGCKFLKRNEKTDGRGRTVHMDQEIKGLRVFGYGIVTQEIEAAEVELVDKGTGDKTGQVVSIEKQTIQTGKIIEDINGLVQEGDAAKMNRNKNRILRKIIAKKEKERKSCSREKSSQKSSEEKSCSCNCRKEKSSSKDESRSKETSESASKEMSESHSKDESHSKEMSESESNSKEESHSKEMSESHSKDESHSKEMSERNSRSKEKSRNRSKGKSRRKGKSRSRRKSMSRSRRKSDSRGRSRSRSKGKKKRHGRKRGRKRKRKRSRRSKRHTSRQLINSELASDAEPVVYVDEHKSEATKAYFLRLPALIENGHPTYPHLIVDEQGNVLKEWDGLMKEQVATGPGGNEQIGRYWYGDKGKPRLDIVKQSRNKCHLESDNVRTIDLQHEWTNSKDTAFEFDCYENRERRVNGAYSPLNDAHYFGTQVFKLYKEWYGSQPLSETPLRMKVHYGGNYENAFWDGRAMTFGDGADTFHPLVSLDIVAHEVSHGLTGQSSNLHYYGQSGGINEAFSDMAGKAAERHVRGWSGLSWKVGRDISKSGKPIRYMDEPRRDGRSIDHLRDYYSTIDVHLSSGIYNKVFHILSNKFKWDAWDAFDLFYVANTKYWQASTTFTEGAELLLKATDNIKAGKHLRWTYDHIDLKVIVNAFYQVGIDCRRVGDENWSCTNVTRT